MTKESSGKDAWLHGGNAEAGIVAVEFEPGRKGAEDAILLYRREGERTVCERTAFEPFIVAERSVWEGCPVPCERRSLLGGNPLDTLAVFSSWAAARKAAEWLSRATGLSAGAPSAPYLFANDPVHQHLLRTGRTCFRGMRFEDMRRVQVDIECATTDGYDFCHAEREGDRIVAIAIGGCGDDDVLLAEGESDEAEAALLRRFVETVRERDPDAIEGHNIFNFDLPYIAARARRLGVRLGLGRDGSAPSVRSSRYSAGERAIAYTRFDLHGRHVVDTLFLLYAYDAIHRDLPSRGLKEAARHFGLAADGREYLDGADVTKTFRERPERLVKYARDDVAETRALANLLSRSLFVQAQMLPFSYRNVCVRGGGSKIDALMVRACLQEGQALPKPDKPRPFAGGASEVFETGVVKRVCHCDVRSLYPSLMLARGIAPRTDEKGVFLALLARLKEMRMDARRRMGESRDDAERRHFDAMQSALKILINSFYGYLGFAQARFGDYDAAEETAAQGRALLERMVAWLRRRGARPVETDTDGIYFVPPPDVMEKEMPSFQAEFRADLPAGVEIEFDEAYPAMYSYKIKNYALLRDDGTVTIKGAALKSRGLEPFQRQFMEALIRLKLEDRSERIPALRSEYETAIRERRWPIRMLARTETLADSPEAYARKQGTGRRNRSAAYELALKSDRVYRAGDTVAYYVTGSRKSVAVHETARLVADWNPEARDENVAYYLAKLDALCRKFAADA